MSITSHRSQSSIAMCTDCIVHHEKYLLRSSFVAFCYDQVCAGDYNDVIMGAIASQITSLTIVYSMVYSGAYQRKHESSASLAFVMGIHRWPLNSPHKRPVTQKMLPFDDVIMSYYKISLLNSMCLNWKFLTYHWLTDSSVAIHNQKICYKMRVLITVLQSHISNTNPCSN